MSGQLILTNLSMTSSGTYRCVATNQMGSASCELTLDVTSKDYVGQRPGGRPGGGRLHAKEDLLL